MNSPQALPSSGRKRRGWIALAILGIPFALIAILMTGCFSLSLSRDAAALRQSVVENSTAEWEEQIEIGVGAIPLHLARLALRFIELEPEARTALQAVKSAEVGVYQLRRGDGQHDFGTILTAADQSMTERGWERLVAVMKRHDCVAIYVAKNVRSPANVRLSVLVVNKRQMVVVSGRADAERSLNWALHWSVSCLRPSSCSKITFDA